MLWRVRSPSDWQRSKQCGSEEHVAEYKTKLAKIEGITDAEVEQIVNLTSPTDDTLRALGLNESQAGIPIRFRPQSSRHCDRWGLQGYFDTNDHWKFRRWPAGVAAYSEEKGNRV